MKLHAASGSGALRTEGEAGLADRSSAPGHVANRTDGVTYRLLRVSRARRMREWPADPRLPYERERHVNEQRAGTLRAALRRAGFRQVDIEPGQWIHCAFVPDERARRTYHRLAPIPRVRRFGVTEPIRVRGSGHIGSQPSLDSRPVRPNVLLIVLDSARADALEPYGAQPGSSPALADLARDSKAAVHPSTYATATWTLPSHVSMFSGLLPRAVGVGKPGMADEETRSQIARVRERLLPVVLQGAGYRTIGVTTNLWISPRTGFTAGFDEFVSLDSGRQAKIRGADARTRLRWIEEAVRARVDDGAAEARRAIRQRLGDDANGRPFFCFVNLIECHSPYLPPRPYNPLSWLGRFRAAEDARRYLTLASIWRACIGELSVPQDALERMRRLYAASIRYLDDWVGGVLDDLDSAGSLDDTIVVVTSDHGENLGEQGLITHSLSLDDRLLRVPFIVANAGSVDTARPMSLAHLPILISELTGLGGVPWSREELPSDVAIAQLDPPMDRDDPRTADAAAVWGLSDAALDRLTTYQTCATDGRYKLLRRDGQDLFFDVHSDPQEAQPVADPARLPSEALRRLRDGLEHPAAAAHAAGDITAPEAKPPPDEDLEELEERMRLLGYL